MTLIGNSAHKRRVRQGESYLFQPFQQALCAINAINLVFQKPAMWRHARRLTERAREVPYR